jgi:hypothetical protein
MVFSMRRCYKQEKLELRERTRRERPNYSGEGVLFQARHSSTILRSDTYQQKQPQPPSVAQDCPVTVEEMSPPTLRDNQSQVPSQSVQAPNANSSSLKDMFTVVATIFQQIMTALSRAESVEDRIMSITETALKLVKQNGR